MNDDNLFEQVNKTVINDNFLATVQEIVSRIDYRSDDYCIEVARDRTDPDGRVFTQIRHWRPDAVTGEMAWGNGGKRYLSPHMTESEIVRGIFAQALGYEEHEVREFFKWRPKDSGEYLAVFGPHISVGALWDVADKLDVRE